MPARDRSRLRRWMAIGASLLLAACASAPPPPSPVGLLQDQLFGAPPRPPEADTVLALSPAMQAHVQLLRERVPQADALPLALARSLYCTTDRTIGRSEGGDRADPPPVPGLPVGSLRLDYDASVTRDVAQAFEARSGNCLSLVVMTAALADALGLDVSFPG